jgi:AcrR family transcriptional regulator
MWVAFFMDGKFSYFYPSGTGNVNLTRMTVKFAYLSVSKYLCRDLSETREHIIRLADSLIRQRGFNAFSYSDIASVLELRNAAIHYHFPTKSLLGQAVVGEEINRLNAYRKAHPTLPGELQFRRLVSIFYQNSKRGAVCLMGALTPEFATFDFEMQGMVQRLCLDIRKWLIDCLAEARTSGRLSFAGTPNDRAAIVISTLLSSLLLSRVEGAGLFRQMVDQLLADLGAEWRTGDLPDPEGSGADGFYSFT